MVLNVLATVIDNWGWRKRMEAHRNGWPANSASNIKFYRSSKVQYRYREYGDGQETLVFAADPPVTLEFYDELLALYATRFRVIIVEMPAMGFSQQNGKYRFGFRETNDDLAEFLSVIAGKNSILAFSCVAGLGAVDIAVRYADLVSKLVLIQTVDYVQFQKWKMHRDPKNILGKPIVGQLLMKKLAPTRVALWFGLALGNREKFEPFCACAKTSLEHGGGWALASAFQNYMRAGLTLGKAEQPILAIWGKADGSHKNQSIESISNLGSDVQVLQFDDLGHFPELEDIPVVFEAINKFV